MLGVDGCRSSLPPPPPPLPLPLPLGRPAEGGLEESKTLGCRDERGAIGLAGTVIGRAAVVEAADAGGDSDGGGGGISLALRIALFPSLGEGGAGGGVSPGADGGGGGIEPRTADAPVTTGGNNCFAQLILLAPPLPAPAASAAAAAGAVVVGAPDSLISPSLRELSERVSAPAVAAFNSAEADFLCFGGGGGGASVVVGGGGGGAESAVAVAGGDTIMFGAGVLLPVPVVVAVVFGPPTAGEIGGGEVGGGGTTESGVDTFFAASAAAAIDAGVSASLRAFIFRAGTGGGGDFGAGAFVAVVG